MATVRAEPRVDLARLDQLAARDRTSRALGIAVDRVGEGSARAHMRITAEMVNGHGTAHGGYLFLLADTAFAYACNSRGQVAVAHHAQVTFLRPVSVGAVLRAQAVERARSGRTGLYDVTLQLEDGTVVAEFRGHSVLLAGAGVDRPAQGSE